MINERRDRRRKFIYFSIIPAQHVPVQRRPEQNIPGGTIYVNIRFKFFFLLIPNQRGHDHMWLTIVLNCGANIDHRGHFY